MGITAYDGGRISAESLGRGGTIASNRGTPASGSENPASLISSLKNVLYTTVQVGETTDLSSPIVKENDPLYGKTLQYGAMGAEKGVMFFEPVGRTEHRDIFDTANPAADFRDVEMRADAIGFAGAQEFKKNGAIGISLSYLRASLSSERTINNVRQDSDYDTADGVRLNMGVRYPTGPTMWGLSLQNAPGFLWWKHHTRDILPVKVRVGNTWRTSSNMLLSVDWEKRFYKEGSIKKDYLYVGTELKLGEKFFLRGGAFGDEIDKPQSRHWTAGLSYLLSSGVDIAYAIDKYKLNTENVQESFLSFSLPLGS